MNRKYIPPGPDENYHHVLKGAWAFKLKSSTIEILLKYEPLYFVHEDLQASGVYYFETYAPVIQWSTIRLVFTMILSNNWHTKQADHISTFSKAYLKEEVYIDPPRDFGGSDGISKVLKLINNIYGLCQVHKTLFDKFWNGLLE